MKQEENSVFVESNEKWAYDAHLVQLSLQGDTWAWECLYRDALPFAWTTVRECNREKVLSACDMEDIIQEAFIRCYERREAFEARSQFKSWVAGFVRKVALEYKRRRYDILLRQQTYSYRRLPDYLDPEYTCMVRESDFCLWLAFDSLTKRHRLLLSCYVLEWENKRDVREKLQISYQKMREEKERAVGILRGRYVSLYCGNRKEEALCG